MSDFIVYVTIDISYFTAVCGHVCYSADSMGDVRQAEEQLPLCPSLCPQLLSRFLMSSVRSLIITQLFSVVIL